MSKKDKILTYEEKKEIIAAILGTTAGTTVSAFGTCLAVLPAEAADLSYYSNEELQELSDILTTYDEPTDNNVMTKTR